MTKVYGLTFYEDFDELGRDQWYEDRLNTLNLEFNRCEEGDPYWDTTTGVLYGTHIELTNNNIEKEGWLKFKATNKEFWQYIALSSGELQIPKYRQTIIKDIDWRLGKATVEIDHPFMKDHIDIDIRYPGGAVMTHTLNNYHLTINFTNPIPLIRPQQVAITFTANCLLLQSASFCNRGSKWFKWKDNNNQLQDCWLIGNNNNDNDKDDIGNIYYSDNNGDWVYAKKLDTTDNYRLMNQNTHCLAKQDDINPHLYHIENSQDNIVNQPNHWCICSFNYDNCHSIFMLEGLLYLIYSNAWGYKSYVFALPKNSTPYLLQPDLKFKIKEENKLELYYQDGQSPHLNSLEKFSNWFGKTMLSEKLDGSISEKEYECVPFNAYDKQSYEINPGIYVCPNLRISNDRWPIDSPTAIYAESGISIIGDFTTTKGFCRYNSGQEVVWGNDPTPFVFKVEGVMNVKYSQITTSLDRYWETLPLTELPNEQQANITQAFSFSDCKWRNGEKRDMESFGVRINTYTEPNRVDDEYENYYHTTTDNFLTYRWFHASQNMNYFRRIKMNGEITLQYPKLFNINTNLTTKTLINSVDIIEPKYTVNEDSENDKDLINFYANFQIQLNSSYLQSNTPFIFTKTMEGSYGSQITIKNENGQHQFKTFTPSPAHKELNIFLDTNCNIVNDGYDITKNTMLIIKQ